MTASLLLDNLLFWNLQIAIVVAFAALASLGWQHARGRLLFWHGILAIIVLMPVLMPWFEPAPEAIPDNSGVSIKLSAAIIREAQPRFDLGRSEIILLLLVAGTFLRLLWIGVGLLRLRRLRLQARRMPVDAFSLAAQWYVSPAVAGPVTYGWHTPRILLPERFADLPAAQRHAIACHEIIHIERGDWLYVLAEEFLRALLWFNPAIWFALAKIQLAREEAVDQAVIHRTADRETYVEALLSMAGQQLEPDLAAAPLFLKKRHLAARVSAVLKEVSVSPIRLLSRFAAAGSATLAAVTLAVWLFPLQSPAQALPDDAGITVNPGGTLLHRTPLHYPRGVQHGGLVVLDSTVAKNGEVTDARVVSGPEELRRDTLASVLQWHYASDPAPASARITVQFGDRAATPEPRPTGARGGVVREPLPRNVEGWNGVLSGVQFNGISPDLKQRIEGRLPVRVGQTVDSEAIARLTTAVREVDEHLTTVVNRRSTGVTVEILLAQAPPPPPPPPPPPGESPRRIKVSSNVASANIITKVPPAYPPMAKQARIQGTVSFTATIGADGSIIDLQLISGHPLLVESATQAVQQWVYRPTLLNGQPVEVITQIDVTYTLSE